MFGDFFGRFGGGGGSRSPKRAGTPAGGPRLTPADALAAATLLLQSLRQMQPGDPDAYPQLNEVGRVCRQGAERSIVVSLLAGAALAAGIRSDVYLARRGLQRANALRSPGHARPPAPRACRQRACCSAWRWTWCRCHKTSASSGACERPSYPPPTPTTTTAAGRLQGRWRCPPVLAASP